MKRDIRTLEKIQDRQDKEYMNLARKQQGLYDHAYNVYRLREQILSPKFGNHCPDCGKKLNQEMRVDTQWPYDKMLYLWCSCGYEYAKDRGYKASISMPAEACFIATATYGSELDPKLDVLRNFRDEHLNTNPIGQTLVSFYYKTSPPIADFIRGKDSIKAFIRFLLDPIVSILQNQQEQTLNEEIER